MMKRFAILLLCGLSACSTTSATVSSGPVSDAELFAKAKTALAATLKDPDSAKFGEMRRVPSNRGDYVCGWINAKNSFGAYVGAHKFSVAPNGDAITDTSTSFAVWVSPCWGAL